MSITRCLTAQFWLSFAVQRTRFVCSCQIDKAANSKVQSKGVIGRDRRSRFMHLLVAEKPRHLWPIRDGPHETSTKISRTVLWPRRADVRVDRRLIAARGRRPAKVRGNPLLPRESSYDHITPPQFWVVHSSATTKKKSWARFLFLPFFCVLFILCFVVSYAGETTFCTPTGTSFHLALQKKHNRMRSVSAVAFWRIVLGDDTAAVLVSYCCTRIIFACSLK